MTTMPYSHDRKHIMFGLDGDDILFGGAGAQLMAPVWQSVTV